MMNKDKLKFELRIGNTLEGPIEKKNSSWI